MKEDTIDIWNYKIMSSSTLFKIFIFYNKIFEI